MASILAELEDLPRFTGRETEQEQLSAIAEYLVRLKDTLRYTLGGMEQKSSGHQITDADEAKVLAQLQAAMTKINAKLDNLSGRMLSAEDRIRRLEDA